MTCDYLGCNNLGFFVKILELLRASFLWSTRSAALLLGNVYSFPSILCT